MTPNFDFQQALSKLPNVPTDLRKSSLLEMMTLHLILANKDERTKFFADLASAENELTLGITRQEVENALSKIES